MSSSSRKAPIKPGGAPRPSFPRDSDRNHVSFLIRSLDKCDQELAALTKLNRTLHAAKQNVVEQCGTKTLIDMGRGVLKLKEGVDELEGEELPAQQDVCVDFLLRMKLRRRLLNRLARRLNRVSRGMDGEDVSAPAAPKYGDLRLHVDPNSVRAFKERLEAIEDAKRRVQEARSEEEEEKQLSVEKQQSVEKEQQAPTDETGEKENPKEDADDPMDVDNDDQEQKTNGTNGAKLVEKEEHAPAPASVPSTETEQLVNGSSNPPPPPSSTRQSLLDQEYEIIKEYKNTYEKHVFKSTGEVKYPVLDQNIVEDHEAIRYGAGIGATHRSMSTKEKEFEFKRWQATILARIPEQPTFEELGMENRVFKLKERLEQLEDGKKEQQADGTPVKDNRKRPHDQGKSPDKKIKSPKKTDSSEEEVKEVDSEEESIDSQEETGEETEDMETEDADSENKAEETDEQDDEEDEEEEDEGKDKDQDEDFTDDDGDKKEGDEEKEDGSESEEGEDEDEEEGSKTTVDGGIAEKKTMSLLAVPSFHDQDMRRIRLIHADLMIGNIHEHARDSIADATNDYNATFRRSNELYNRRIKVQAQLNSLLYESRLKLTKMKNEYALEVAIARSRWQRRKEAWDAQKLQTLLPVSSGRVAIGTPLTAAAASRPEPIASQVGERLSNIVDAVVMMTESGFNPGEFEPFVAPPAPSLTRIADTNTGETIEQQHFRLESSLRAELTDLSIRVQNSEEDRKRAWKKMLKTRAEFETPNQQWASSSGRRGRGQLNPHQLQFLPVPPLRASAPAVAPPTAVYASSVPAYVPPSGPYRSPGVARAAYGSLADSKYSIAKVKERIAADGSVAPVSEPKKTKDGLYQRPAGRTRKGMEWDAVRGIWVPAANGG